jgi:beta-mannosidase
MTLKAYTSTPLTKGWTFKRGDRSSTHAYLPACDAPTEIYRDLLKNEQIADPFNELNELAVRWVGDETWTYRTTFAAPSEYGGENTVTQLRFEGLDTFASVVLNGEMILESDSMFIEHEIDVTHKLKLDENVLEIVFDSARKKGLELVEMHKGHRSIVHQTEISRGPVRKAQYHWGWDWGPILMSCGPWKPVSIKTWTCQLSKPRVQYKLSEDLKSAKVTFRVDWEGRIAAMAFKVFKNGSDKIVAEKKITTFTEFPSNVAEATIDIDGIDLWWPRGFGEQELYTVRVEAFSQEHDRSAIHSTSQHFGFRTTELITEPDSHGTSFYFRINGVDIFCGGSCWIPADSFLTRLTPEDYRAWVKLTADGNQTMLRVWGGGIYEADALYDAADEFGVLIWQDFMFACANYPAYPDYLKSVNREARQNVRRLEHHPSVVLWAGNNEDYQIVERYGLQYDPDDGDPDSWLKTNFPARYIYEHMLPDMIETECPNVPYHPSSPFGNGKSTVLKVDSTIGDIHQWNVWHGTMEPYQRLPDMGGRFVSEFGMEAYPHVSTLETCITRAQDRYPGSMAMDFRNKAIGHERRLISYVAENFRIRYDLESFTHLTQIMQSDAMSWAYKSWRRQWNSPGDRKCGGALVWQLNDCWPTMSWAVVDYYGVPKPAYYAIKRAMQPIAVGVQRKYNSWTMRPADKLWQRDTGHIDMRKLWQDVKYDLWVANSTLHEVEGDISIRYISIKTGKETGTKSFLRVQIAANGTTDVLTDHAVHVRSVRQPDEPFDLSKADPFVIHVSLYVDGQCLVSDVSWPEPIKYLEFANPGLEVNYSKDKTKIFVSAAKPVKGFVFSEGKGMRLSDNGFDLVPGETREVEVEGLPADKLKWKYIEM